jgi:ferredoxin
MTKVTVDQDLCIGCGACESACIECFEIKEDGKSHVIAETCACDLHEVALNCPVQAIDVTDEA